MARRRRGRPCVARRWGPPERHFGGVIMWLVIWFLRGVASCSAAAVARRVEVVRAAGPRAARRRVDERAAEGRRVEAEAAAHGARRHEGVARRRGGAAHGREVRSREAPEAPEVVGGAVPAAGAARREEDAAGELAGRAVHGRRHGPGPRLSLIHI